MITLAHYKDRLLALVNHRDQEYHKKPSSCKVLHLSHAASNSATCDLEDVLGILIIYKDALTTGIACIQAQVASDMYVLNKEGP